MGSPLVPEQADKAKGKNVIISEPRVAPNVEKDSRLKVVLEKGDNGKSLIKITAGSNKHLNKQQWFKTVAAHHRPARPTPRVGQADLALPAAEQSAGQLRRLPLLMRARLAKPTPLGQLSQPPTSGNDVSFEVRVLRTFVPHRREIGSWKKNEEKKGKIVKNQCTIDRLMSKYRQQRTDSKNQPLKKRVYST